MIRCFVAFHAALMHLPVLAVAGPHGAAPTVPAAATDCDGATECDGAHSLLQLHVEGARDRVSCAPLVAVLEHEPLLGKSANETIQLNLDAYCSWAKEASRRGAKLLVTSEYGITGYNPAADRATYMKLSVDLPPTPENPDLNRWVPCRSGSAAAPEPLRRLSCMAKESKIAIVASLVDRTDCRGHPDWPSCQPSRDGFLLFNTNVVLDSDGAYLARYHKVNLWGESWMDASTSRQLATFTPKEIGVKFGLFTCADVIYSWPALHLVEQGVRHFAMPLAWSNEMAQMQPLGWVQSWSRVANATLLASNQWSRGIMSGSGIFSQGDVRASTYELDRTSDGLVVAPLPVLPDAPPAPGAVIPPPAPAPAAAATASARPGASALVAPAPGPATSGGPSEGGFAWTWLDMSPGPRTARVCAARGGLCCEVHYAASEPGAGFVVAVLQGLDGMPGVPGVLPWTAEVCAVLPCSTGTADCMTYPTQALESGPSVFGTFEWLRLRTNMSSDAKLYPVALAWPERLLPRSMLRWDAEAAELAVGSLGTTQLVSLEIYGRRFSRDPKTF